MATILLVNCRALKFKEESEIIEALTKEVYYDYKSNSRIENHGIVFQEYTDYDYFVNYDYKKIVGKSFYPDLNEELIRQLFDKKAITHYNKQLLDTSFDLSEIRFMDPKIRVYSDDAEEKFKNKWCYKVIISKPVYSLDKRYVILYSSTPHEAHLYLFHKESKNWILKRYG